MTGTIVKDTSSRRTGLGMNVRLMATLAIPIFFASCLIVIITLGSCAVVFPVQNQYSVLNLTAETVLQFVGGLNKILDVLAAGSLGILTNAINTIRLTHPSFDGIALLDLDLKEALCSPIQAIIYGHLRYKKGHPDGKIAPKASSVILIAFTTATSICVWLLPLASNTLMIPKLLYHPLLERDGWPKTDRKLREINLITPGILINDIHWDMPSPKTTGEIGLNDTDDVLSHGKLASSIYSSIFDFNEHYRPGWNEAKRYPGMYSTAYMHTDSHTVRAASVRAVDVETLFNASEAFGPSYAKLSVHKWSDMNVTTPSVTVQCSAGPSNPSPNPKIRISGFNNSTLLPKLTITLDSVKELGFGSLICNMSLQQALFPLLSWTLEDADDKRPASPDCGPIDPVPAPSHPTSYPSSTRNSFYACLTQRNRIPHTAVAASGLTLPPISHSSCSALFRRLEREPQRRHSSYNAPPRLLGPTFSYAIPLDTLDISHREDVHKANALHGLRVWPTATVPVRYYSRAVLAACDSACWDSILSVVWVFGRETGVEGVTDVEFR
ncbi:hypothetical protein K505DRAFT_392614 [Melanomma pulvis-pyrius CBS 109.77]|uniref:Uncharacterized protein n=1 Tax=Melanomma pulvis-pyrius CBS 109.77 TaxID=1314802 RepID=A0A6A6XWH9_9PLEO|nr:hypothetical protein K505DRAFT_392614 [Melanomma pulvis-pyrius CBS 109.77]